MPGSSLAEADAAAHWKGAVESAAPVEREVQTRERAAAAVQRAYEHSRFYRARFDAADLSAERLGDPCEIARLPVVRKQDVIDDQRADPPLGSIVACDSGELVRTYLSGGPESAYFTADDLAVAVDQLSWAFHTNGFRPHHTVDVICDYRWVSAGTMIDDALRSIGCNVIPGGAGSSSAHLQNLLWANVTGLFVFPTFLDEMSDRILTSGAEAVEREGLTLASIAGEMPSPDFRSRMSEVWPRLELREQYGTTEVPAIAAECRAGSMHLNPDYLVEIVDVTTGEPAPAGQPGVIVATETSRRAFPMIRFWTGDITAGVTHRECECGRTTPVLGRLLGRAGDILRVKGRFVVPKQVGETLRRSGLPGRFQLVATRPERQDRLAVRIERPEGTDYGEDFERRVADALRLEIGMSCDLELVSDLDEQSAVVVDLRDGVENGESQTTV